MLNEPRVPRDLKASFIGIDGYRQLQTNTGYLLFYTGNVNGSAHSNVAAYWNDHSQELTARIELRSDVYFFEPLSVYSEYSGNTSMLLYRLRDIRITQPPRVSSDDMHSMAYRVEDPRGTGRRVFRSPARTKRTTQRRSTFQCRLTFIADYLFFQKVGDADRTKTIHLIISLFYRLNALFESSDFSLEAPGGNSRYGFLLANIIVHEAWNSDLGHYNAPTDVGGKVWSPHALSDALNYAVFNSSCLAHLLTYRPFKGILGRAWMAAPELGGICSAPVYHGNRKFHTNTGWTTYASYDGRRLPNAMAELITAHELGHNWGAAHDPDTPECNPPAKSHGKYLMYTHSVSGFSENNYKFSPCSRRTIGATLATRAPICFVEASQPTLTLCGNGRLDYGEECDAGTTPSSSCCTPACKLRSGAQCDPWNHGCCTTDCQIASANTVCADIHTEDPCLRAGRCNGTSSLCPGPTLVSGLSCADHGQCVQGRCESHCSRHGLKTCICDDVNQSCYICCLFPQSNLHSFVCKPVTTPYAGSSLGHLPGRYSFVATFKTAPTHLNPNRGKNYYSLKYSDSDISATDVFLHLDDYRPCTMGYCLGGKCQEFKQHSILRFWHSSDESSGEYFVSLVQNNLIVLVITVTLLIWTTVATSTHLCRKKRSAVGSLSITPTCKKSTLVSTPSETDHSNQFVFKD